MKHEFTAGRIAVITGVIALVTACIYLALAVGSGSTEYECQAKGSCSKTIVRGCRQCELQSPSILVPSRSSGYCGGMDKP